MCYGCNRDGSVVWRNIGDMSVAYLFYEKYKIKESSCCGTKCKQVVIDGHGDVVKTGSFACPPMQPPQIVADLAPRTLVV